MQDINFTGDDLIAHIGLSVHHPFFQKLLRKLNHETPIAKEYPNGNGLRIDKIWNHNIGIHFDFTTPIGYFHHTGIGIKELFTKDKYELILGEVHFSNERKFKIIYPFELEIGDDIKIINKKIGRNPQKKYKSNGSPYHLGYICYYYTDSYQIIAYLTMEKKLLSINFQFLHSTNEKFLVDNATIKKDSKILLPMNLTKIENLKNALPIKKWRKRFAEGDSIFNEKNLNDSENLLFNFIDEVSSSLGENSNIRISNAIKKVVKGFNKLNIKHENFIETMEREELAEFINKIAILTGLTSDNEGDITEEWREW